MSSSLGLHPDQRIAGVLIPVFAIRDEDDLGIGDVGSLRHFIDWSVKAGFGLVQLLPINETGGDNSPYNAISSMALDPSTLELKPGTPEELTEEDYRACTEGVNLAQFRLGSVDYSHVKPLKTRLLEAAFQKFEAQYLTKRRRANARLADFRRFQQDNASWLESYGLFRALMDLNGGTECWDLWPLEQQTYRSAQAWLPRQAEELRTRLDRRRLFFTYVQWIAYSQWRDVKRYAEKRGVALMGDIPLGVSFYSADFFGFPQIFETGWSGGAPPEPYFKDDAFTQKWGQNWGIPVYNWPRMREDNFAWWRQRVHGVHDLFHVFRIDHILGFYRIYSFPWRPARNAEFLPLSQDEARALAGGMLPGFKARGDDTHEDREQNCRDGDALLRVILEAAGDTRLIGEDLGTVPPYVRPNLTELGIAGFKIPLWEPDKLKGGLLAGQYYDRLSVATFGTHDHEPLAAFWRREIQSPEHARGDMHLLADWAGLPWEERTEFNGRIHDRLLSALFQSNSWIVICMITDLLGREERFNVPGTAAASNWSQRMPLTVQDLDRDPAYLERTARFRALVQESGRALPSGD